MVPAAKVIITAKSFCAACISYHFEVWTNFPLKSDRPSITGQLVLLYFRCSQHHYHGYIAGECYLRNPVAFTRISASSCLSVPA
jgi:hypothetical protein